MGYLKYINKKKLLIYCGSIMCIIAIIAGASKAIDKVKENENNEPLYSDESNENLNDDNFSNFDLDTTFSDENDNFSYSIKDPDKVESYNNLYMWYILKTKNNHIMARLTTTSNYIDGSKDYYYDNQFDNSYNVIRVMYNAYDEKYYTVTGDEEIIEITPLRELIKERDYTRKELYQLLMEIKENNKKRTSKESYTLVKD